MPEQLTLYSAKVCPYAHRVEIALKESGLSYDRFEIDLKAKPEWYAPRVNPASKVPAISYGGPKVAPDQPSAESQKLAESLVLLEFIADLTGLETLLPKDPLLRAKARFFIETFSSKAIPAWYASANRGESPEKFLEGIQAIQALLPAEGYAIGEWSIADAAVTPFLARAELAFKNDLGAFDEGDGKRVYETLQTDPMFERFRKYFVAVKGRKSFQETFDPEHILNQYRERYPPLRAQRLASVNRT
ncbi:hypothetical protein D9756_008183 [Leucocoprinus leucothites]|uniref:GST N-terminal domain-containing protein n=1 Tax=Leucocoprinus leucothites TaxID=201217 RepID=A0A8H5D172_9AGAR|nr:hypothetical protein D9756_008183 [Leucoagaricus leucothites]